MAVSAAAPTAVSEATVQSVRRAASARLSAAGVEDPEADARLLVAHVLGVSPGSLAASSTRGVSDEERTSIERAVGRREAREPLAYIVGEKEFWSLPFGVSPAVLIPRPDTETVVEAALAFVDGRGRRADPWRIADLGTGSGALLIALLSELPNAFGVGIDISMAALAVARTNAVRHRLASGTLFARGSFAAPLGGGFDLIVSNPPYVEAAEIAALAPEVRAYEPHLALDGGPDGLAAYREIAVQAVQALRPGGALVVEIGAGQSESVAMLMAASGLVALGPPRPDLAGIPRAAAFLWPR